MFSHLVESDSHREDLKRRGAFVFGTLVLYVLLFSVGGVISIYAYKARLESQSLEMLTLLPPVEVRPATPLREIERSRAPERSNLNNREMDQRRVLVATPEQPNLVPREVSNRPSDIPPVRPGVPVALSDRDVDAQLNNVDIGPTRLGGDRNVRPATNPPANIEIDTQPPAQIRPTPPPRPVSLGPITGQAISLPKPAYPPAARAIRAQGAVTVQIVVDETGKVISAQAVSGHFTLRQTAEQAAYQARFRPTTLGGQPVKVSGTITFNFVLEH